MKLKSIKITAAAVAAFLLMTVALCVAVPAEKLPSLTGVYVDSEGVLRWDAFPGADSYDVTFATGGGFVDSPSYSLATNSAGWHLETGTYTWKVYAIDAERNPLSEEATGEWTFVNNQTPLSEPQNLVWDHTTARWDAVEGAEEYHVSVYQKGEYNDALVVSDFIFDTCWELGARFRLGESYYFKVYTAAAFEDILHNNSGEVQSGLQSFEAVVPSLTGVKVEGGILSFDPVPGAEYCNVYTSGIGSTVYSLPLNLYEYFRLNGAWAGVYDLSLSVYNGYGEPLAPEYTYTGFAYDPATAPEILTGDVSVSGTLGFGCTLTASLSGTNNTGELRYTWVIMNQDGDVETVVKNSTDPTIVVDLIGCSYRVEIGSTVELTTIASTWYGYSHKADGPDAPTGIDTVDCTGTDSSDGKITGVTPDMEYRPDGGDWIPVTGSEITGLTAGSYHIRYRETDTVYEGYEVTVIISVTEETSTSAEETPPTEVTTQASPEETTDSGEETTAEGSTEGTPSAEVTTQTGPEVTTDSGEETTAEDGDRDRDGAGKKTGLSGGAIAGIVIGAVCVLGAAAFAVYTFVIKKK